MSLLQTCQVVPAGWLNYHTCFAPGQPPERRKNLADPALCSSLPLNARCGEVGAGHNISRKRSSPAMARFGLSATRHPEADPAVGCRNQEQIRFQEESYETNGFTDVVFLALFRFDRMAASTST